MSPRIMAARPRFSCYCLLLLFPLQVLAQDFSLYPTIDPDLLASALNISVGCLDTLNTTLPCDNSLFQWTVNADDYFWSEQNLTTLCTADCASAVETWEQNVALACINDDIITFGTLVPAFSVAGRYQDGYGACCLQSQTGDWCMVESISWVGSDVVRPDCSVDPTAQQCLDPYNVTAENERMANIYNDSMLCSDCFIQMMYYRITSDYLPDSDYSDYLVGQFQDIQDVCSTTVVANISTRAIWTLPTVVPVLADEDSNSTSANTTLTLAATTTFYPLSSTSTGYSVTTPMPTQTGMVSDCAIFYEAVTGDDCYNISIVYNITVADFETWNPAVGANCTDLYADTYYCIGVELDTTSSSCQMIDTYFGVDNGTLACNELAVLYGVTTGDLIQFTGDPDECYSEYEVCLPASCELLLVPDNSTCASLAATLTANSTIGNITTTQLLSWNPNIIGTCDSVQADQYICAEAPGGSYVPPYTPITTVNPGGQEMGGPGGADPTAITGTSVSQIVTSQALGANPTAAPAPTQVGIVSNCNQYSKATSGDSCVSFASNNSISASNLYIWNSVLGVNGANCNTMLLAGYYYCTGTTGGSVATTTMLPTSSPITSTIPSPTQSGIISSCNKYTIAPSGSYCSLFAQTENITTTELYDWNTILGPNGADCSAEFFAEYYYCVGVIGTASTSSATPTPTTGAIPSPTQSGIVSNCDAYAAAPSGSYCSLFAQDEGISTADLYEWNTVLGTNGANCNTEFFAEYYYCIGVS